MYKELLFITFISIILSSATSPECSCQCNNREDIVDGKILQLQNQITKIEKEITKRSRMKYAISNAVITGDTYDCQSSNLLKLGTGNRYCSLNAGEWIYFELNESFTINLIRFRLYDLDSSIFTYNVDISSDKVKWDRVASEKLGKSMQELLLREPVEIRYIRMSGASTSNLSFRLMHVTIDLI